MYKIGALLVVLLASAAGSANYPSEPDDSELIDPQKEMARLGSPTGTWEGVLEPIYDMTGVNPRRDEAYKVRLSIRIQSAEIAFFESNGEERVLGGVTYKFEVDNTVLISYVLATNGFVEYMSFALAQVDPDTLKGYQSRLVHNLVVPNTSPWRMLPNYSALTLERVK